MEFPAGELALDEPSFGGLTFNEALMRWGRMPKERDLDHIFYWDHPGDLNNNDEKLIDKFISQNIDNAYLLKNLSDKPRYQLLRRGVFERWLDKEIIVFGFPLHSQDDRRVCISPSLINELRHSLRDDPVSNFEARHGDHHARGARSYAQVRFYLDASLPNRSAAPTAGAEPGASGAAARPSPAAPDRRSRTMDAIEEAARMLYAERKADPPNMVEAERLIRERLPGATRDRIREVLNKPEFKALRRPAGKLSQNLPS